MARLIVTPSAGADTAAIVDFLKAQAGLSVATRYVAAFERLYEA